MKLRNMSICAAMLLLSVSVTIANDEPNRANEYKSLVGTVSPALVTIKFVLKTSGAGGSRDFEREITATMMNKDGLVLCSGVQLGTSRMYRRMGTVTPTDLKILIGDDTVGIDAKLVATDAELDLAWVQVKEASKLPADMKFVDFAKAPAAELGDRVMSVNRMDKFFDRAPIVSEGRIVGTTTKPRELLVPGGGLDVEPGMPVFNAAGAAVGVAIFQSPDPDEMEAARGANATLILPTAQLNKATTRALATAAEESEEEDDSGVSTSEAEKPGAAKPESEE